MMSSSSTRFDSENDHQNTILWMHSVLLNNLEGVTSIASSATTSSTTFSNKQNTSNAGPHNGNSNETRLMVLEHELRMGDYLGEDRFTLLSQILSVKIKYMVDGEDEDKYQFWVIKIPQSSQEERALVRVGGLDKREIAFYTEILPTIKMWIDSRYLDEKLEFKVPYCMYGKYDRILDEVPVQDPINNLLICEYILVLEDMRPKEYGKRHFSVGMPIPEVMAVVSEIAKIHATTWAMQEICNDTFTWDTLYNWKSSSTLYFILIEGCLETLENFLKSYDDPDSMEILQLFKTKYSKKYLHILLNSLLCPANKPSPTCLVHMDLWSENLLFRIKDEDRECQDLNEADVDVCIIDWQVVAAGRPTHDLAILFLTAMSPEDRREYVPTMLEYYYETFSSTANLFGLKLTFGFDVIQKEYCDSFILAALLAVGSIEIAKLENSTKIRLFEVLRDLMRETYI